MKKIEWTKYALWSVAALLAAFFTAQAKGFFSGMNARDAMGTLSDCFLIPGVFLCGIGGLRWIGSRGGYDGLGYGASSVIDRFRPHKRDEHPETYYEYIQRREAARAPFDPSSLIVGGACLALALAFFLVYCIL